MPKFEEIYIGQVAEKSTLVSKEVIREFARVTDDNNPIHFDEEYAKLGSFFRRCVAHGMISVSLVSALLGSQLPGLGTIFLSQNFDFKAPVFPGDTVTARVEVLEKDEKSQKITLKATVTNQQGAVVVEGRCLVMQRLPKAAPGVG
jgi:3-hydroxybutyryl-CoA dehydratase